MNLDFTPDESISADGENLFEAVQRQLGLKLEAQKGPVEVVVSRRSWSSANTTALRDLSEWVAFNSTAAQPLDRSGKRARPECIRLLPQPRSVTHQPPHM